MCEQQHTCPGLQQRSTSLRPRVLGLCERIDATANAAHRRRCCWQDVHWPDHKELEPFSNNQLTPDKLKLAMHIEQHMHITAGGVHHHFAYIVIISKMQLDTRGDPQGMPSLHLKVMAMCVIAKHA